MRHPPGLTPSQTFFAPKDRNSKSGSRDVEGECLKHKPPLPANIPHRWLCHCPRQPRSHFPTPTHLSYRCWNTESAKHVRRQAHSSRTPKRTKVLSQFSRVKDFTELQRVSRFWHRTTFKYNRCNPSISNLCLCIQTLNAYHFLSWIKKYRERLIIISITCANSCAV